MAKKRKNSGMWEDDFEDISSFSQNDPPLRTAPAPERRAPRLVENRPSRPPAPDWEIPEWELQSRRSREGQRRTSPRRPNPEGDRPGQRRERPAPQPRKRSGKPMGAGARRIMVALTVLVMAAATALLAVFLLFKVSDIQITGDVIEGCENADILAVCGYQTGDNLFFISTRSKEKLLKEKFPYIGEAEITRHLPGTLEIKLTKAKAAACLSSGGSWLLVSEGGKVLEKRGEPVSGVLQVFGLTLPELEAGQTIQLKEPKKQEPDESGPASSGAESSSASKEGQLKQEQAAEQKAYGAYTAYQTIISTLNELSASEDFGGLDFSGFTTLNLSDLSDIRLVYQERIEFQLGSALELYYKVRLGCTAAKELSAGEKGVMDLTYAHETKRAFFTAGAIAPSVSQAAGQQQNGGAQQASPSPSPSPKADDPRNEGIPDKPFTGEDNDTDGGDGTDGEDGTDGGDDTGGEGDTGNEDDTGDEYGDGGAGDEGENGEEDGTL